MAALECPYCGSLSAFVVRHTWDSDIPNGSREEWGLWTCSNSACRRPIVGLRAGAEPIKTWPETTIRLPALDDVPESIRRDALEAHTCLHVTAYNAAAVMARRAIQGACFDKGAPDKRPVDQIDFLREKHLITPQMAEIAHHLRTLGGSGAHPGKDGLKDVTPDEAREALAFLSQFMEYVYTIPAKLERLRPGSQLDAIPPSDP